MKRRAYRELLSLYCLAFHSKKKSAIVAHCVVFHRSNVRFGVRFGEASFGVLLGTRINGTASYERESPHLLRSFYDSRSTEKSVQIKRNKKPEKKQTRNGGFRPAISSTSRIFACLNNFPS